MAAGDAHVFPGFLTPVLIPLSFPKPPTTFLRCFSRGERRKYAGKKVCLKRVSNSQPLVYESDTLTTELPGRGDQNLDIMTIQGRLTADRHIQEVHDRAVVSHLENYPFTVRPVNIGDNFRP